jgi:spore coat protein A
LSLTSPLTPFVDPLPLPPRLLAREHEGALAVRMRAGAHRFHRDLPESRVWGYDGGVPGPTIEAERGYRVRVEWINDLDGTLPIAVNGPLSKPVRTASPCSACPV